MHAALLSIPNALETITRQITKRGDVDLPASLLYFFQAARAVQKAWKSKGESNMKLRATEIVTLDGVMEEPNQWFFQFADPEINKDVMGALRETNTFLFGRRTYVEMASAWPGRTGEMADIFNLRPKYVISSTL